MISRAGFICDQIYQKGSYARTASGLTFHGHSTDTIIDQQLMLVPLPKLQQSAFTEASFTGLSERSAFTEASVTGLSEQSAFTEASFTGLSGVHGCLGGL